MLNISNYSISQITSSIVIVIGCIIALGLILPKIITSFKNLKNMFCELSNTYQNKEKQMEQVEQNTNNIKILDNKIDKLTNTLNQFIEANKQVNESIIESVNEVKKDMLDSKLDKYRSEVLDFANTCKNKVRHTSNEFLHIIDLGTKYNTLIDKYKIENGAFEAEFEYIKRLYNKCLDENDFLE